MVKTSVQTHLVRQWELLGPESPLFLWKEGLLFGWRIKSKPWSLCPRLPNMGHIHRHMLIGTRGPWSPEPSSSHTSCLCTHTHSRPISISSTPAYSQHVWENFSFSPPKSKILLSTHPKPSNLTDLLAYHSPDKHVKAIRTETGLACSSIWGPLVSHLNPLVSGPWGGPMGGMGNIGTAGGGGANTCQLWSVWPLCFSGSRALCSSTEPFALHTPGLLFRLGTLACCVDSALWQSGSALWFWWLNNPWWGIPCPSLRFSAPTPVSIPREESDCSFLCACHFFWSVTYHFILYHFVSLWLSPSLDCEGFEGRNTIG